MAELTRSEKLRKYSVGEIEDIYRRGWITAADKNKLLREKTHAELDGMLEEKGYVKTVLERSITHLQEGWDNLKEAVMRKPTEGDVGTQIKGEAYYAGLAVWGQIQMVTAAFSAIGEVTGQVAERLALRAGASPGLARAINFATDVGTGFIPVGTTARSVARTVQDVGKVGTAATAGKAAGMVSDDVVKAAQGLVKGLDADGVKDAAKVIKSAAESAGQPLGKAMDDLTEGAAQVFSVKDQFLKDLAAFQEKMGRITKVQSHEETAAMAERMGLTLDDLKNIVPGQALNEKEMYAYLKALEPQVQRLQTLAQDVLANGTQASVDALARHASELFSISPVFRGAEVTAGRAVEILKETPPMKRLTDLMAGWSPEQMAAGDFNGAMRTFAEDLVELSKQPDKLTAMAVVSQSNFARFSNDWWPKLREVYINMLLSRPLTQVRNFLGNSIAATNAVMEQTVGAAFSADKQHGLVNGEGVAMVKGMAAGIGDGLKAFGDAYTHLSPEDVSKLDYVPHQIGGTLGRIINFPGDTLRGMDNFFKTILRRGSYYAEALRDGTHRGLNGGALADFVARRVNNPTQAMMEHADDFALMQTFQNDLGQLGQAAQKLQTGPLLLWFPFMKTPINLAKYAWNRTPGLQMLSKSLYEDVLAGGTRADLAIGRMTLANLQGMFLFNLAQDGLITGSGPVDPTLKRSWLATHQPYSIRTKDGWVPISNLEPGTTVVGLMADYAQVLNQLDEPSASQGAMAVTFSIMKNLADKTYWQSVNDLVDLTSSLTHGEQPTVRAVSNPAQTLLTGGPLMAATARIIDPISRESRSFMDGLMARVPGYSSTLPPRRDGYGDPILPPQTIGGPWLSLFSPAAFKPAETDAVKLEGERLRAKLPSFPWNIGGNVQEDFDIREPQPGDRYGIELTPQQRDRWQQIYKNVIRSKEMGVESKLMGNSLYRDATPAMQRETFEAFLRDAKSTALDALLVEDVGLNKKLMQQESDALMPMLNFRQQQQTRQVTQDSLNLLDPLSQEQRQNLLRWGILAPEEPALSNP